MDRLVRFVMIIMYRLVQKCKNFSDQAFHNHARSANVRCMTSSPTAPTNAKLVAAKRGRPRTFNDVEVLDSLIQLFWTKGFEATSMADIVQVSGLSKSSLYSCFGSKDELFRRALDRYIGQRSELLMQVLTNGTQGLDDLGLLLDALWTEVTSGNDHRGCLAINTSTELASHDDKIAEVTTRFRATVRDGLRAALTRASALGEIDPTKIDSYAAVLLSFMLGTAVIVRGGGSDSELLEQVDAMRTIVNGWQV
jgi:AcrR family transcriptional regulator